jgi:hypothetical protein
LLLLPLFHMLMLNTCMLIAAATFHTPCSSSDCSIATSAWQQHTTTFAIALMSGSVLPALLLLLLQGLCHSWNSGWSKMLSHITRTRIP